MPQSKRTQSFLMYQLFLELNLPNKGVIKDIEFCNLESSFKEIIAVPSKCYLQGDNSNMRLTLRLVQ